MCVYLGEENNCWHSTEMCGGQQSTFSVLSKTTCQFYFILFFFCFVVRPITRPLSTTYPEYAFPALLIIHRNLLLGQLITDSSTSLNFCSPSSNHPPFPILSLSLTLTHSSPPLSQDVSLVSFEFTVFLIVK